ncbi:MAG: ParB/RepB/Spo0J family partition protein [Fusobacteriota bacterium]
MGSKKSRLGKGIGALIQENPDETHIKRCEISKIVPNAEQPRKEFDSKKIDELSKSIKENGILQPIIVRKIKDNYEIIAGERRYRAAKKLGLKKIEIIIKEVENSKSLELALIENIQRENLNSVEEAKAYKDLKEKYNYTQNELAQKVGKSRSSITNAMRILKLPQEVLDMLTANKISSGHARSLLSLENMESQIKLAKEVIKNNLTVRDVEKIVKDQKEPKKNKVKQRGSYKKAKEIIHLEHKMRDYLGTKVKIKAKKKNTGKIEVEYYSPEDLERILETIGIKG